MKLPPAYIPVALLIGGLTFIPELLQLRVGSLGEAALFPVPTVPTTAISPLEPELDTSPASSTTSSSVANSPSVPSVVPESTTTTTTTTTAPTATRESEPVLPETPTVPTVPTVPPVENEFLDRVNEERVPTAVELQWNAELAAYAKVHLRRMMTTQTLHHSDITRLLTHWSVVGENVGKGTSVDAIHSAYMNSPTHAENVVDPVYTHFGSASETDVFGVLWTVTIFGAK